MREIAYADFRGIGAADRREILARHGIVLVTGMSVANEGLLDAAASFGAVSSNDATSPQRANREPDGIYLVQPLDVPLKDRHGHDVLSTTHEAFALHTDQFFQAEPAALVLLLCCESDGKGGETLVADVGASVSAMPPGLASALTKPFVRVPFGFTSILRAAGVGTWHVAYNRYEIEKFCRTLEHTYAPHEHQTLNAFDTFAAGVSRRLMLHPGDCLLIDNRRVLHGRTAIAPGSRRLVKRLRVRLDG